MTLPIALRDAGHSSCRATTVVTASGGIWNDACWAIAARICATFTRPSVVMNSVITASMNTMRFLISSLR